MSRLSLHDALPISGFACRNEHGLNPGGGVQREHRRYKEQPRARGLRNPRVAYGHRPHSRPLCPSVCRRGLDRKSTRLNSSHTVTSYAVFCLKKKMTIEPHIADVNPVKILEFLHAMCIASENVINLLLSFLEIFRRLFVTARHPLCLLCMNSF